MAIFLADANALIIPQPRLVELLSPLIVSGADDYSRHMRDLGVRALDQGKVTAQFKAMKAELKALRMDGPKVALYHIQEFIY